MLTKMVEKTYIRKFPVPLSQDFLKIWPLDDITRGKLVLDEEYPLHSRENHCLATNFGPVVLEECCFVLIPTEQIAQNSKKETT